jgi:hypothetical protein
MRYSNRLLSEQNVEFRELLQKLMMSDNDPTLELTEAQYNLLYRTIESFMRGYCSDSQNREV